MVNFPCPVRTSITRTGLSSMVNEIDQRLQAGWIMRAKCAAPGNWITARSTRRRTALCERGANPRGRGPPDRTEHLTHPPRRAAGRARRPPDTSASACTVRSPTVPGGGSGAGPGRRLGNLKPADTHLGRLYGRSGLPVRRVRSPQSERSRSCRRREPQPSTRRPRRHCPRVLDRHPVRLRSPATTRRRSRSGRTTQPPLSTASRSRTST